MAFLVGLSMRGVAPTAHLSTCLGDEVLYKRLVNEYDLVNIRYVTPAAFETDVRALGVTAAEFKACKLTILRAPHQKICTRSGLKCFEKKSIYERNETWVSNHMKRVTPKAMTHRYIKSCSNIKMLS